MAYSLARVSRIDTSLRKIRLLTGLLAGKNSPPTRMRTRQAGPGACSAHLFLILGLASSPPQTGTGPVILGVLSPFGEGLQPTRFGSLWQPSRGRHAPLLT